MGAWKGSLTPGAGVSFQVIVDDNGSIRELLRAFVETNTPFKVCGEAENGAEAIKMAKKLRPDLVLLDLTMPGMSGTDTAWLLQVVQPRPKIILFTIHADGLNHELGSIYGIDVVLSKTDSIGTIVGHITTLLSAKARKRNASRH
jgi:DNA-binding NarL/FixJ family response regulator